jgi:hypothetical protein
VFATRGLLMSKCDASRAARTSAYCLTSLLVVLTFTRAAWSEETVPVSDSPSSPEGSQPADTSATELAALEAELAGSATGIADIGNQPSLSLYGFTDFSYGTHLRGKSTIFSSYPTFLIGNFNVYLAGDLVENWRSLAEVRFLYMPHGQVVAADAFVPGAPRVNTSTPDYADIGRPLNWGGVEIERVWLERTINNLLTVRLGQWLTPYGIWNVDHGSPTIIGVYRPYIVGESLFPERQTGIELYGGFYVDATKVGYHLTLSNGRGAVDAFQDLDHHKAFGARLYFQNDSLLGDVTLGFSGYRGTFTDRPGNFTTFEPFVGPVRTNALTARYRELALAVDLKWEWEGLVLQAEAIMNELAYADRLRPTSFPLPGVPPSFTPDGRRVGFYSLLGYRTPWWNLMPFVLWQKYENPLLVSSSELQVGLNMRLTAVVVLKGEYIHVMFDESPDGDLDYLTTQAAWSF